MNKELKKELINSIRINGVNLDYIRKTKIINGTLYHEISRIMDEYLQTIKEPEENFKCSDCILKSQQAIQEKMTK